MSQIYLYVFVSGLIFVSTPFCHVLDCNLKRTLDSSSSETTESTPVKKQRIACTRETARKSTGGKAPRKQLVINNGDNPKDVWLVTFIAPVTVDMDGEELDDSTCDDTVCLVPAKEVEEHRLCADFYQVSQTWQDIYAKEDDDMLIDSSKFRVVGSMNVPPEKGKKSFYIIHYSTECKIYMVPGDKSDSTAELTAELQAKPDMLKQWEKNGYLIDYPDDGMIDTKESSIIVLGMIFVDDGWF